MNGSVITWINAADLFIRNFYDDNGRLLTWLEFKTINNKREDFHFKWRQILHSIPRVWKEKIANEIEFGYNCVVPEPHLQVISRRLSLLRLEGKQIYTNVK